MKRIKHYLAAFFVAVLLLQSGIGVLAEETHGEEKIFPSGNSYEEIGSLIVKGMRKLINRMKHRESKEIVLGRWSALCSVFQLILLILIIVADFMISSYELSKRYTWIFGVIGGFGIAMTGMIIYGIIKFFGLFGKKEKQSTGRKIYNALTVFFSIVTVINILYWNLYL